MKINSRLMPEHTFTANELRETCIGLQKPRSIVTGLEMWAPDWCGVFFWKMNTCHPWPYIPSVHCFPEGPEGGREGGEGRAAWWTSGTGEHPRQWYLIRLPQPSTGRRTIREKKSPKYVTSQASKQGHSVRDESCVSCYPHSSSSSSSSFFYFDLRAEPL